MRSKVIKVAMTVCGLIALILVSPFLMRSWNASFNPDYNKTMKTRAALDVAGSALESWIQTNKRLPNADEGLRVIGAQQYPIQDGWGRPIVYHPGTLGSKQPFELYSLGESGVDKHGEDGNINYWASRR